MKKIVLRILAVIALLLAVLLVIASTKPDSFRVERSLSINAPADTIQTLIADFRHWEKWSPYEKIDPAMKKTYSGLANGKGAVYEWAGNSDIGAGRMEITGMTPAKITVKLDFTAPFEAHNTAEFILEPEGAGTKVTWAMYGPNHFLGKFMGIFFDMDQMIGKDFETGLSNLKAAVES